MTELEHTCGNCALCIKDDGSPYCPMKDLFTNVEPDDICDEYDIRGKEYFTPVKFKD